VIGQSTYGPGAGRNKKEAEQNAAAVAFAALKSAAVLDAGTP
jgi:ribonuclease III